MTLAVFIFVSGMGEIFVPQLLESAFGDGPGMDEVIEIILNLLIGLSLFLTYRFLRGRSGVQFLKSSRPSEMAVGMLTGLGLIGVIVGVLYIFGELSFVGWVPSSQLLIFIIFFASVSFAEEMLTRGVLQHLLPERFRWIGILIISLLFGLLHLGNPGYTLLSILNTTLVGIFLSLATLRTKSLHFALGFHFTWNLSLALLGMTVSGYEFGDLLVGTELRSNLLTGYTYGIEGGSLVSLVFLILVAIQGYQFFLKGRNHAKT